MQTCFVIWSTQLAAEGGGALSLTAHERKRLEQLLGVENDDNEDPSDEDATSSEGSCVK